MALIKKILDRWRPVTYYEELAETGLLENYISEHLREKFESDDDFRNEILYLLMKHSKEPLPVVEELYLDKLCQSLSYFLEYTEQWRKQ
ncbi:MAG: hypothetical protein HW421_1849 [Ignavibacteria bacterium]|nr:hypothetical protein [Ignavibacteria bacterium]